MKKTQKITLWSITVLCAVPVLYLYGTVFYIAYDMVKSGW